MMPNKNGVCIQNFRIQFMAIVSPAWWGMGLLRKLPDNKIEQPKNQESFYGDPDVSHPNDFEFCFFHWVCEDNIS